MNDLLRNELISHLITTINDQSNEDQSTFNELHHHAFNEDYYIIGYYNAEQWLKKHDVSAFEVIEKVIEWENDVLGECTLKSEDINSEKIVNLYVYIKGEELINDLFSNFDDIDSIEISVLLETLTAELEE